MSTSDILLLLVWITGILQGAWLYHLYNLWKRN